MSDNGRFDKLLSPFQIKQVRLRNRIVKPPQATGLCIKETGIENQGGVSDRIIAHYESLSRGGVGLIMAEAAVVDFPLGLIDVPNMTIYDDKFLPGLSELTRRVHDHGAAIFVELIHGGPVHPKRILGQPVAASSLPPEEMPIRDFDQAREVTIPEIKDIQLAFADAAERAKKAGFDGVEIHGSQRYLINTFLSRAWNKRQDEYGCQTLENRARFGLEVMQAVRERVGQDFVVGIRLNGMEWGLEKGITSEESQAFGKMFEAAGADFLDINGYGYGSFLWAYFAEQLRFLPDPAVTPWLKTIDNPGLIVTLAENVKKVVSIPVIGGGRVDPYAAEEDLQKEKVDLVFMGRRLLADPQLPNKLASGNPEDIAPCTACCECMEGLLTDGEVRCRVNASLGKEQEYKIKPATKKKKVMVVGGGPAGMETARVAALRGHEVVLYEKEHQLGGQLPLATMIKGSDIEDIMALVGYLKGQIAKSNVKVRLGQEVTLSLIEEVRPDVVIMAAGGLPTVPNIPGIQNSKKVITAAYLHRIAKPSLRFLGPGFTGWATKLWMPLGKKIVVMGGQIQGCQLAVFLVKRGREVTIVEQSDELGAGIVVVSKQRCLSWLRKQGVIMHTGVTYEEVTDKGLVILTRDGKRETIEADHILPALPLSPNRDLGKEIEGRIPELYWAGDCAEPRRIVHAIADGSRMGHAL
jgi:2,4-dienoyl-CoA reductase (NADPH2)